MLTAVLWHINIWICEWIFSLLHRNQLLLLLLNSTAMLYYINFHTSASNGEQIQNGNNGKNHETVVIKYLVQQIKTLEKSNKKLNERLKNCMCFQSVHKNILQDDEKVMFYTGIPKLSTFFNLCIFISLYVAWKWCSAKSTNKPSQKLIKSNLNKKRGPVCKLSRMNFWLHWWKYVLDF